MVTDCVALFNSLIKWLNPTRINTFSNWMLKQGRELWMQFKAWYWGLNCDVHERFVRMLVPVVPAIDEELCHDNMCELIKRTDDLADEPKLEECLVREYSINDEYNQDCYVPMKKGEVLFCRTPLDCNGKPLTGLEVDDQSIVDESETDEAVSEDEISEARAKKDSQHVQFKMDKKAAYKQRHRIIPGMMEAACRAVEIRLRVRHGLVPSNELNEQAIRMTALEICREYNINEADTLLLTNKPVWKAMIPDQMQMDALRIIYNGETQSRLNTVEMLRNSAKFSVFNLQPNC